MRNSKRLCLLDEPVNRRGFLRGVVAGVCFSAFNPVNPFRAEAAEATSPLFWIKHIPDQPFIYEDHRNYHFGVEQLLPLMGDQGLKFYRSSNETLVSGPLGLIAPDDVVLIKVNAQWKYRGCTNSDLIRGLIQRILDHPDGFTGEVVIFENGQGRGSLNCDTKGGGYPNTEIHANANDETHSFLYLVNTIFDDPRVSAYLLDPIRQRFISNNDRETDGYRRFENVSYPCFTTAGGHRVELRKGLWNGTGYTQNLKLINVPVLKCHGGSEITASLKHFYGIVSMVDGQSSFRHYSGLGETCGKMAVSIRTPVLNIIDAIWVSHGALAGYPAGTTFRANQILASQDPVALDYWAVKYIFYPITRSPRHLPTFSGIDLWLTTARENINNGGGLLDPESGIQVDQVTKNEKAMQVFMPKSVKLLAPDGYEVIYSGSEYTISWDAALNTVTFNLMLSLDQGATWNPIPGAQGITGNTFAWLVPPSRSNKRRCFIKVTGFDSDGKIVGSDRSAVPFTIEVVKLTAPSDPGISMISGETYEITWIVHDTLNPVETVELYYTRNGTAVQVTWIPIDAFKASEYPGTYPWQVPQFIGTRKKWKVKVVLKDAVGKNLGADASDNYFRVQASP